MLETSLPPDRSGPQLRDRIALRVLQIGSIAVVLASLPYKAFDLDRYFVPKELVLHVCAAVAAVVLLRARQRLTLSVIDAVLASSAVPGLLPPAHVDGEHYIDGGIVNSIPLGEAVNRGGTTVYVLQVGRAEEQLVAPARPTEVAKISFEIARRHRFSREIASVPPGVVVHVLPSGGPIAGDEKFGSYRRMTVTRERMVRAYRATSTYLQELAS